MVRSQVGELPRDIGHIEGKIGIVGRMLERRQEEEEAGYSTEQAEEGCRSAVVGLRPRQQQRWRRLQDQTASDGVFPSGTGDDAGWAEGVGYSPYPRHLCLSRCLDCHR